MPKEKYEISFVLDQGGGGFVTWECEKCHNLQTWTIDLANDSIVIPSECPECDSSDIRMTVEDHPIVDVGVEPIVGYVDIYWDSYGYKVILVKNGKVTFMSDESDTKTAALIEAVQIGFKEGVPVSDRLIAEMACGGVTW